METTATSIVEKLLKKRHISAKDAVVLLKLVADRETGFKTFGPFPSESNPITPQFPSFEPYCSDNSGEPPSDSSISKKTQLNG